MGTLIESILKRPGGTVAEVDGVDYHFQPNNEGAHVCDIEDEDAVARFLSIPEGYKLYKKKVQSGGDQESGSGSGSGVSTDAGNGTGSGGGSTNKSHSHNSKK